ncbi:hypothetical protein ACFYZ3_38170 [Streptomyces sp. NPDC001599]|uniref:hypothetical protein n=1 Tax=Streptomyces sp. NPDC001599 TaxID=3364591 RepID=UPI0036B8C097
MEQVVRSWDPDRYTRTEADAPAPPVPPELFDAVPEACLTPLAAYLLHPEPEEGWEAVSDFSKDWSLDLAGHSGWAMLARCPERWSELATHPTLGAAVQHLLLDHAETQALKDSRLRATDPDGAELPADPAPALSENLLRACLPALCLPELAGLPNPQVTARRTLHHIANRVRSNPRLADLAADQLHAAADALVTRGQLLTWSDRQEDDHEFDGRVLRLAEDPALLSTPRPPRRVLRPARQAGSAGRRLPHAEPDFDPRPRQYRPRPRPPGPAPGTPLRAPPRPGSDRPRRQPAHPARSCRGRLGRAAPCRTGPDRREGRRPRLVQKADRPDWFLAAAAAIPVPEDEDDGVVRLVDDDELGKHPDPAAVLQSWLDSPATGEILSRSEVYRAVAKSRYRTLEHLRQIPADEVLANHEPDVALTILLDRCGRSTDRWGTRRCHDLRLRRREDHLRGTPRLLGPDARRGADILTVGRTVGSRDSCHTTLL